MINERGLNKEKTTADERGSSFLRSNILTDNGLILILMMVISNDLYKLTCSQQRVCYQSWA